MNAKTQPDFGPDNPPTDVTIKTIADQIRTLDPRALSAGAHDDVLTMIAFLRDRTIALYDQTNLRQEALDQREKALAKREAKVTVKARAAALVIEGQSHGNIREVASWFGLRSE